ncbi:MAG: hypothetical protein M3Q29_16350 [Chloroflexota bacterium]|nr:hypothetical protein [Chloroflexota bacterium]
MTIKGSEEWREHALHPEKSDTGESPELLTPAAREDMDEDVRTTMPRAMSEQSGSGSHEAPEGGRPGTGPLDDPAGRPNLGSDV